MTLTSIATIRLFQLQGADNSVSFFKNELQLAVFSTLSPSKLFCRDDNYISHLHEQHPHQQLSELSQYQAQLTPEDIIQADTVPAICPHVNADDLVTSSGDSSLPEVDFLRTSSRLL